MEKENREYKDSVFRDLFAVDITAKENQLSLYNALHGTTYEIDDIEIQDISVDQVLYMNFKNDVSWQMADLCIFLAEHQSTINENICLRFLMYVGRIYEKLIPVKNRYDRARLQLSRPEFYVFYNGAEDYPMETEIALSESFSGLETNECFTDMPLELRVKVININLMKKHPLLEQCPVLKGYAEFIEYIREYKKEDNQHGIKNAIQCCIERGILKEYLSRKGSEVRNMLIAEYDYELDIKTQREEAERIGEARGKTIGIQMERQNSIRQLVGILQDFGGSFDLAVNEVSDRFLIPSDEAIRVVKQYWRD